MDTIAIVPLKALRAAKSRLAPTFDASARRTLAEWMFVRVLDACREARAIDSVLVVAGDDEAAALVPAGDVEVLVEPLAGLRVALGRADAATQHWSRSVVVPADLPLLRGADLDALVDASASDPGIVLAPTSDGGTGGLVRTPPTAIPTAFGPSSAARHAAAAAARGLPCAWVRRPAFACDVDTATGLATAAETDPELHALRSRLGALPCAAPDRRSA